MILKNRSQQPEHQHFVITCGPCGYQFPSCGIPCFAICPACVTILTLWEDS